MQIYRFCSVLVIISFCLTQSQLSDWIALDDFDDTFPSGVKLFKSGNLKWNDLNAWLITADLKYFNQIGGWSFEAVLSKSDNRLSTVAQFSKDFNAVIATNGGFFGKVNGVGSSYSLVERGGEILSPNIPSLSRSGVSYFPTRCAFGVDKDSNFEANWIYQADEKSFWTYEAPSMNVQNDDPKPIPNSTYPTKAKNWDVVVGVGGGPMLVHKGSNIAEWAFEAEVMWGSGVPNQVAAARTAIGVGVPSSLFPEASSLGPHLLWMAVDGVGDVTGLSLRDLGNEFTKLKAEYACNLDGGGSTQLVVNQSLVNNPDGQEYERSLAAAVMLLKV